MPYCPQCGREQKCGCLHCHTCGVELVERPSSVPAGAGRSTAAKPAAPVASPPVLDLPRGRQAAQTNGPAAAAARVLPALLVVLGVGVLIITAIEAAHTASAFTGREGTSTLWRLGYYFGSLLYSGSVRTLTGFALLALGLLLKPPAPFSTEESWRPVVRIVTMLLGLLALVSVVSAVLLMAFGHGPGLLGGGMLPPMWATVPLLLVLGAVLGFGAYLTGVSAGAGVRPAKAAAGERTAAVKSNHDGAGGEDEGHHSP